MRIVRAIDPDCVEEAVAGGKGSSLARLTRLGVRVPPFIVVSAQTYRELGDREFDEQFLGELRECLSELNLDEGLAVRSSAIGEDAADSSFAGLYHTSLMVRGFDDVLSAIRTCWASYRNQAAREYRETRSEAQDGGMAVVIQEMIEGEWSGVCFTANPVNQSLAEGMINAVTGLGEALVSGDVNPEEITIAVPTGRVVKRHAGQSQSPLPEEAVTAVWAASKAIADQLRFPQDTEWAWRDGELYILQSRPITTIADVFYSRMLEPWREDPKADPDMASRIWSRMLADETWVSPISPLFYNVHNSTPGRVQFLRLHGDRSDLPPDIFKYHKATAYADVRIIRRMYEYQPRIARIQGVINFLPPDMQGEFEGAPFRWRGRLRRLMAYEFENRKMRSFFHNYRYVEQQWPRYVAISDRWFDMNLDDLPLDDLRRHHSAVQQEMAAVGPPCAIAVLSHASDLHLLLTGLLERWCSAATQTSGENLYARVSAGLDGSETVRESEQLWEIGNQLQALHPDLVASVRTSKWSEVRQELEDAPGGPALVERFERFWRAHRHLGSSYKDLIWPRWGDDIELCFDVVKGYLGSSALRPSLVHARSAESRRAAQREILESLSGPLAPFRRWVLSWLFRYNEIYMSIRDNHRYYVDRNWYELRRIYRSYGKRLVDAGVLESKDDVFFLGTQEVEEGLNNELDGAEASRRVEVRRRVWQCTLREQGPKFLRAWEPYLDAPVTEDVGSSDQLRGIAASPGAAVGIARVVYDVSGLSAVKDGEILVTRQTDPSWTTVFGRISGLVLETGGVLSHGTSLCREYGLPCVTAVERATVRIRDGSRIELVGSEGVVRILEPAV